MTDFLSRSLLITRPFQDSVEVSKEIDRLNKSVNVVFGPLFEIETLPIQISFSNIQALIVTSSNAVKSLSNSEISFDGPMYCIGSATSDLASKLGFSVISANGNSLDLKNLVVRLTNNKSGKLLYFRGEEVFSDIAGYLRDLSYCVDEIICYKKVKLKLGKNIVEGINNRQILGATFFSRQTVNLFFEQVTSVPKDFIAFCISEEVSKAFDSHCTKSFSNIRISKSPNLREMCKLITAAPEFKI